MKQPKIYYFMSNSHHYLISRIDKDSYGIFDLCTTRYTDDRWKTLEEAIEGGKKYYKELKIYDTYTDLFNHMLAQELSFKIFDMYEDKDLIERESLHDEKAKEIYKKMGIK